MNTSRGILFPVGIAGHLYQIAAFREVFSAPVIAIVFTEEMDALLTTSSQAKPDRVYSFPKFYKQHKDEVYKESLRELYKEVLQYETRFKVASSAKLYFSDRYFRQEKSWALVIRRFVIIYRFVDHVFAHENPVWLKSNLTTMLGLALSAAAVSKGIPAIKPQEARVAKRVEFIDEVWMGALRGWRATFENIELKGWEVIDREIVEIAVSWLEEFRVKPKRPKYAEQNSVLSFNAARFGRNLLNGLLVRFTSKYWVSLFKYKIDRELNFRAPLGEDFVKDFLFRELRAFFMRRSRYFRQKVDLDESYIYFPLQFSPEITTTTYAVPNDDQSALITALAKSVPGNTQIFVKEHTSMIGRRPSKFYKDLSNLYNVNIVSPALSTFDLIHNATAIATINSTVGWEAYLFGKPVLAFGEAFYREFPGVLRLDLGCTMDRRIRKYLDEFEPNEEEITNAVIAYFYVTGDMMSIGDIGIDTQLSEADSNALKLALEFKKQVEHFSPRHQEML